MNSNSISTAATLPTPWTLRPPLPGLPPWVRSLLLSSPIDPAAVVCVMTESPEPIGTRGWLHVRRDGPTWSKWRSTLDRLKKGDAMNPSLLDYLRALYPEGTPGELLAYTKTPRFNRRFGVAANIDAFARQI